MASQVLRQKKLMKPSPTLTSMETSTSLCLSEGEADLKRVSLLPPSGFQQLHTTAIMILR